MNIRHVNPEDTYNTIQTRGYTQVVEVRHVEQLIFVSGQLPLDAAGNVVGAGDIEAQARVVFDNMAKSLASVGVEPIHIVKLTTYVTDIVKHPPLVRKVRAAFFRAAPPPASTMVEVTRFASPGIMIEMDAIAVRGGSSP
jgi:enamine deaminase RidA (YjgF/YER057c/UK114 family)